MGIFAPTFVFFNLSGINKEHATHLAMGLLLASFVLDAKHCVHLLKQGSVCQWVYAENTQWKQSVHRSLATELGGLC